MNIGFISTRFAGTDGVSLEAAKWAEVLTEMGHSCYWYAGQLDLPEPESGWLNELAFFEHPEVAALQAEIFSNEQPSHCSQSAHLEIERIKKLLKEDLSQFVEARNIELLIPQNILAIPMHLPLGLAVAEFIEESGIATIAHHHDFYWERERFLDSGVEEYLGQAFPPRFTKNFAHVIINSAAQRDLQSKFNLSSKVVPNVMDFAASPPSISEQGQGLRDDLGIGKRGEEILILQPSRIVARKGIEYALLLVQALQSIPYGKPITLVISHLSGDEGFEYEESLRKQAQGASVRLLMIGERVQESAGYAEDGSAIYALADVYHQADFVTYPSLYEGFGNALLESLWYGKPTLVNRYSVFRDDIETLVPESLKLVSIDGQITTECVDEVQALLNDPQKVEEWAAHNRSVCQEHFSYQRLTAALQDTLKNL